MKKRYKALSVMLGTAMLMSLVPSSAFAGSYVAKSYEGSAIVYCDDDEDFDNYQLTVSVPVDENGTVGTLSVVSYDQSNASYVNKAVEGKKTAGVAAQLAGKTVSEVMAMGSVDTVSGATCTSNALLTAVKNALAKVETVETPETPENPSEETPENPKEDPSEETPENPEEDPSKDPTEDPSKDPDKSDDAEDPDASEKEVVKKALTSVSVGGANYYYTNTKDDEEDVVYQISITSGRGENATTTVTDYKKSELTQLGSADYYYTTAPGATALSGKLYGSEEGSGTATNYSSVYSSMGALASDPAYDCVSSATAFSGYHAKDISSTVTYGTDASGQKAITGLDLGREVKSVDADTYVAASILKAAGETLTEEQAGMLAVKLKPNPTVAPSTETIQVSGTGTWTTSRYGDGEFAIVPDESAAGYVWSEYWDKVYAATISDGTTTVGAVHWIDLYGEAATSGPHYNKVEIALNNGTSVGANAAVVSRFAAFYNEEGQVKPGTYTITVYADGYSDLTVSAEIAKFEQEVTTEIESIEGTVGDTPVAISANAKTTLTYSSSDESVATVDENGQVTFTGAGSAVITVTAVADSSYEAASVEIPVTVAEKEEENKEPENPDQDESGDKPSDETPSEGTPSDKTPSEDKPSEGTSSGGNTSGGSSSGGSSTVRPSGTTSSGGTVSGSKGGSSVSSGSYSTSKSVNTGDTANVTLWGSLLAITTAALGFLGFKRKKH